MRGDERRSERFGRDQGAGLDSPVSRTQQAMSFVQLEMRAALAQILRNEAANTCCLHYARAVTRRGCVSVQFEQLATLNGGGALFDSTD